MCAQSLQSCPTLLPCGLWLRSLLCPRDSPGENTGVGSISFSGKGIFLTQLSNLSLMSPVLAGRFFITSATLEAHLRRCLYSIKDTAQSGPYEDVEVVWQWLGWPQGLLKCYIKLSKFLMQSNLAYFIVSAEMLQDGITMYGCHHFVFEFYSASYLNITLESLL